MKFEILTLFAIFISIFLFSPAHSKVETGFNADIKNNNQNYLKILKDTEKDTESENIIDEELSLESNENTAPAKKREAEKKEELNEEDNNEETEELKTEEVRKVKKKFRQDPKPKSLTLAQKWKKLFTVNRETVECADPKIKLEIPKEVDDDEKKIRGALVQAPVKALDIYSSKAVGFGTSAYLFDFLDETLQRRLVDAFSELWKAAMAIVPKDEKYEDPYALATMLLGQPRRMGEIKKEENVRLLAKLRAINPKFDEGGWMKSLDAFKINALIKQWKWDYPLGTPDPAKYIINKFDLEGDGRLSIKEILIASIITNKRILGGKQCKHCYEKVVNDLIDPIFHYADCDADGKITAEELWQGLKLIKRDTKYNFYKCIIDKANFRTSAVNDFFLKAAKTNVGSLTIDEFRIGVLMGYWTRQVSGTSIVVDDALNRKKDRWPGGKDLQCEEMEMNIREANESKKQMRKQELKKKNEEIF